jgi:hypothetical protein
MTLSNAPDNSLLQAGASPYIRDQTVSLFMPVMRVGMAHAGLLTGISMGVMSAEVV